MESIVPCPKNDIDNEKINKISDNSNPENLIKVIRQISDNAVLLEIEENGRFTPLYISDNYANMMEYSVDELKNKLKGLGLYKIIYPEDRALARSIFKNKISYDGSRNITIQHITGTNKLIWCKINYSFIDDYNKHFIYCTFTDITKQKINEERIKNIYLKSGNTFYQNTENTLSIFRVNLTNNFFIEINGKDLYDSDDYAFSYSDSVRKRAENFPIESEKKQFLQLFNRESLINNFNIGKSIITQVLLSKRKNDRYCFVRILATFTIHPFSGNLIAFIKEQEYNKEKIENSLIKKILGKQFDFVAYMINGYYNVTYFQDNNSKGNISPATKEGDYQIYLNNQVYNELTGSEKEIEEQKEALKLETIDKELAEKDFYSVNILVNIDGEIYHKKLDFYPINRETKFYLFLKSDTTQIQKHQLDLNKKLRIALDSSQQANKAKTSFLSLISHEMRTPMNAIIGLDKLALNEPGLTSKIKDYLVQIESSANQLLSIINNTLDMSRIESGRIVLNNARFSFKDIINQVNIIIESQCKDKIIKYECILDKNINIDEYYFGDDLKIKEIFLNILGNAVKFTNSGGKISLIIDKITEFNNQTNLRIKIIDTGIGIDSNFLDKIFEPFSQEDSSRTTLYGSTGLGMAITKNFLDLMNGKIEVESEKGKGSTFTVFLTLKKDINFEKETKDENNGKKLVDINGKRILLAEDIAINAEIIKQILKMKNIEVTHAKNGKEVIDIFNQSEENYFDAILMDIRMPELDGLLATEKIRKLERADSKSIPIIALTANTFDEDVQKSLQSGMNAHLNKPIEIEKLFRTLSELIQENKQ